MVLGAAIGAGHGQGVPTCSSKPCCRLRPLTPARAAPGASSTRTSFQVEATTFLACPDEEVVLQIRVWTAGRWCVIGLDGDGVLRANAWADGEREAEAAGRT